MSLINLSNVTISFGGPVLLDGVNLQVQPGERLCLLGRNGSGKTTLMKLINRDLEPDIGGITRQQGFTSGMLTQEVPQQIDGSVFDVVLSGLGESGKLPMEHHHLSVQIAEQSTDALLDKLDKVQKALEVSEGWELNRQAETVITRMKLDPDAEFNALSAGMKRRTLLARALVCQPDLLLLDEPTNHLDIDSIAWMEEFLLRSKSTLLFVTHDRMLVRKLATRIIELDRGKLSNWDCNYDEFLVRKEAALEIERQQWNEFDKKLAREEVWIRQGIKARRTRNEGRVNALLKLRQERRERLEQTGTVTMRSQEAQRSGKLVVEAKKISFAYPQTGETPRQLVVRDLTSIVMRGDRVGIIGPNGCGKTTLLKLLLGELQAQEGSLRQGTNLKIAYFDQLRNQLEDEKSVQDNVANGSDMLLLDGKNRHVIGYLQEFLFPPDLARSPVKVLSGGERNRLLLAKLFAAPANLLVMDEPTNDLDVETLELLEDLLINYKGTLLLVSHDRTFLNNVVTNSLVFEGEGKVAEYIGGYDDWVMQRPVLTEPGEVQARQAVKVTRKPNTNRATPPRKLSNKENLELEKLPAHIEALEKEEAALYREMEDPGFYQQDKDGTKATEINTRLEALKQEMGQAYHRWEELEELKARHLDFKS